MSVVSVSLKKKPKQHLFGVKLQKARLVGAGGVKDEIAEAQFDIVSDALDLLVGFFFSSRRRHTRLTCDWSSDVYSSDLHDLLRRDDGHHRRQRTGRGFLRRFGFR